MFLGEAIQLPLLPGFTKAQMFAARHPSAGCIGSYAQRVSSTGRRLGVWRAGPTTREQFRRARDAGTLYLVHSSMLVRRELLLRVGGYPEDFVIGEDMALYNLRLAPLTEMLVDPVCLETHELNPNSITRRVPRPRVDNDAIVRLNVQRRRHGEPELSHAEATAFLLAASPWARWGQRRQQRSDRMRLLGHSQLGAGSPRGLLTVACAFVLAPVTSLRRYRRMLLRRRAAS